MADAGLHVMHPAIGTHAGAEVLRRQRLADRADVVLLALDGHQAHPLDRGGLHRPAAIGQFALRQEVLLKHVTGGVGVEFRRQVHYPKKFFLKRFLGLGHFPSTLYPLFSTITLRALISLLYST